MKSARRWMLAAAAAATGAAAVWSCAAFSGASGAIRRRRVRHHACELAGCWAETAADRLHALAGRCTSQADRLWQQGC